MEEMSRPRRLPPEITRAPMRTVRPVMLRALYANPEKELVRLHDNGLLTRIAHGTYIAKPDTIAPGEVWKPPFEEAAMAYATAAYGNRVPILAGLSAARHWHAIPRAIGVAVIAVPAQHRPVTLKTGGRIIFIKRSPAKSDAIASNTSLGVMMVTSAEQTLVDLILRPTLGGMPNEALAAAAALAARIDKTKLNRIIANLSVTAARRIEHWLSGECP